MLLSVLLSKNQRPSAVTPALAAGASVCGKKVQTYPSPQETIDDYSKHPGKVLFGLENPSAKPGLHGSPY
jgi:hypothetical protein